MTTDTYLTLEEAEQRTGIRYHTLRRRIACGELPAYRDPCDLRRTLVLVNDLDRLVAPERLVEGRMPSGRKHKEDAIC